MSRRLFGEAVAMAHAPQANLYGSVVEVSENDVHEAYAECVSLAYSANGAIAAIGFAADAMVDRVGEYVALVAYGEAEGGFLKKILDTIVKLFEKVKGFFTTLLGRFKSNKAYRDQIATLQAKANTIKGYSFQDKAVVTIKEHSWAAIGKLVTGILAEDSLVFKQKYSDKTIEDVTDGAKNIVKFLESDTITDSTVSAITDTMSKIQSEHSTVDMWLKFLYGEMVKGAKLRGDANSVSKFEKNSSQTPAEAVNKMYSTTSKTLKGKEIVDNEIAKEVYALLANDGISYDKMVKALEEGQTFFTDKANNLKEALNELQKLSTKVNTDSDSATDKKAVAQKASNISSQFSVVVTNYSTVCLQAFNTGKLQLDKLLSEVTTFINAVDKAREQYGNKNDATA